MDHKYIVIDEWNDYLAHSYNSYKSGELSYTKDENGNLTGLFQHPFRNHNSYLNVSRYSAELVAYLDSKGIRYHLADCEDFR